MKTRSCAIKQNFLLNSLGLTAIFLFGTSMVSEFSLAQPATSTPIRNTASYDYTDPSGSVFQGFSSQLGAVFTPVDPLIDPFGTLTSCDGGLLADYTGFSVGLYEVLNASGDIGVPISLTATVPVNQAAAGRIAGVSPNFFNSNPFFLVTSDQGKFNFLLDVGRGQVDVGREYILAVRPPASSPLGGRRIKITITARNGNIASYTAIALDGAPISATSGATSINGTINVSNAEATGLSLAVAVSLNVGVCEAQSIQLLKTGDRAAAEPGDIVVYRLNAKNLTSTVITSPEIRDDLPLGFQYVDGSVRAEIGGNAVAVTVEQNGRSLVFRPQASLPKSADNRTLNIVYAAQVTNDAIRGTGLNRASIAGIRTDNKQTVRDGPVSHLLRIRPGILSDCGTLIGRVFVDKNFDGEQQPGEPGVPNAVIYMDDGNRIVTDPNGLYSLSSVLSGSRTLAIDLTSVPGYTLAPNLYFIERNSQSRLVKLAPGSLGRVNFAVTPVARGIDDANQGRTK
jgi:fimbrial isopeptide formation D2 family protein